MRDFARIAQDAFDMFETSDNPSYRQERSRSLILLIIHVYRRAAAWIDIPHAYICTRGSARIRDRESGSETNVSSPMLTCLWARISKYADVYRHFCRNIYIHLVNITITRRSIVPIFFKFVRFFKKY